MSYYEIQPIALAILTSIITGGFVLVFVEIGNRKNRENDRHEQIMTPFMHKLSSFFRFINWCRSSIVYPQQLNGYEVSFKKLVEDIGGYGGKAIVSGGDYGIGYFTADELNQIALDINNIWYYHDKMNPCRLSWNDRMHWSDELIPKELTEVNPRYLKEKIDVNLVAKVSGDFYTDAYQPIEDETYRHEAFEQHFKRQTVMVSLFVCFVLLMLSAMLFWKVPVSLLQTGSLLVIVMLASSLLLLAIDARKQIRWWNKFKEFVSKHKPLKKKNKKKVMPKLRKFLMNVFQRLLSSLLVIGMLLAVWAIFSND